MILNIYKDSRGLVNIYKERSGSESKESHDIEITIKSTNQTYSFKISSMLDYDHIQTEVKGPISILKDEIILFDEGKNNTSPGAIYTIQSKLTSVDIYHKKMVPPPTINGQPAPHKRSRTHSIITISNQKPGFKLSAIPTKFVLKSTDGKKFEFNSDNVAALSYIETDLHGDLASISVDGIYLYNTASTHTKQKREIKNTPCSTNAVEEIIYDINTEAYPTPTPISSGTFSIRRTMDGQIVVYQENASGPGNSSVNYEISAMDPTLKTRQTFVFNEGTFSLSENQKIGTGLYGLTTVKRNRVVLFDELDGLKNQMTTSCITDLLPKPSRHAVPRAIGHSFYTMSSDGSPLILKVKFMSACPEGFKTRIMNTVKEWEKYAHVQFVFLNDQSAEFAHIRISLGTDSADDTGSYSACGTDALWIPKNKNTMKLPLSLYREFQNTRATEADIRYVILHEFGHTLGLAHEHQHPNRPFQWNKSVIYQTLPLYGMDLSQEVVYQNFFGVINRPGTFNSGEYDPHSVMNYAFPSSFTFGSSACPPIHNRDISELSDGDKTFIAKIYPKPNPSQSTKSDKSPIPDDSSSKEQPPHKPKPDYIDTSNEL